jgi:hypothetical protein
MGFRYATGRLYKPRAEAAGGGWWDLDGIITSCIAAYQAKGAASYAASLVNLANPGTHDLTVASGKSAPNWSAVYGWYLNDGNEGLDTGIEPDGTENYTIICRFYKEPSVNYDYLVGISSPDYITSPSHLVFDTTVQKRHVIYYKIGGIQKTTTNTDGDDVLAVAGNEYFKNGVSLGTVTVNGYPGAGINSDRSWKVCFNASDDSDWKVYAASLYSSKLLESEIAAIGTAMNAL